MNKNLPVLKILLYPAFGVFVYSAYCYYSQKYYKQVQMPYLPVRYYQKLEKQFDKSTTVLDLERIYYQIYKHTDKFIINPSTRDKKVAKNQMSIKDRTSLATQYKISKQLYINHFNALDYVKEGHFVYGFWNSLSQIWNWKLRDIQISKNIMQKMIDKRQSKCRTIAQIQFKEQISFINSYQLCLQKTKTNAMKIKRFRQIIEQIQQFNRQ